ncbi:MAG TPA: exodeoxyribonuclease VII small subunit [Dehalococcoidia bacterium]|nr:exodeoxyribonuclease VII small subunit [Dehalococcoidia bacterium]
MASNPKDTSGTKKTDSFEAQYKKLEETVARLEAGNLTLEESLALYEEGAKLAKRCQELLRDAELRVSRLQEQFANGAGVIREEPADYDPTPDDEPAFDPDDD